MALQDVRVRNAQDVVQALVAPAPDDASDTEDAQTPRQAAQPAQASPRLEEGVELIGEFEGSGFKQPPFIARRGDGQVVQMPRLLFRLAEEIDGRSTTEEIALRVSNTVKRRVEAADVQMLIEQRLRPLGIVACTPDGESIELSKVDPLLALKFRVAVVPERAVRSMTTIFRPLFHPAVLVAAIAGMLGLDAWLFFEHGIAQSVRHVLYQPALMLLLIAGVILATAFHEIGHATACRYGGAKPGVMGVGIYIVWPAFYTDITDAYRLGRWGRLRADTGGMYFNAIFALLVGGLYAATSFEALLLLIVLQNFAILQQSLPLLRLDGYYILSDLTGVPDIFLRIRAVLRSLIPGRAADPRVAELKSWVRVIVSGYVVLIVVFLGATVLALVINLPRIVATGYDSAAVRYALLGPDFSHGQGVKGVLDLIEMIFLVLPAAGLVYTVARVARRGAAGAAGWSSGHPDRRLALGIAGATAIALAAFSWWPNGEYRPVQPTERGAVSGLLGELAALPTGRPSLTVERQRQLHGAPTELQRLQPDTARATTRSAGSPATASKKKTMPTATTTTPTKTRTTPPSRTNTTTAPAYSPTSTSPSTTTPSSTNTTPTPSTTPTTTSTAPETTTTTPTTTTTTSDTTTTPTTTTTTTSTTP